MRYLRFQIQGSGLVPFDDPAKHVVDRGLDLLDARYVIRADDDRVIREPLSDDPTSIVAYDADGQKPSLSGFGERGKYVGGVSASGDTDSNILRPRVGDELAGEDRLCADVVGYGRYVGRLRRQGDRRNGTPAGRRVHAV